MSDTNTKRLQIFIPTECMNEFDGMCEQYKVSRPKMFQMLLEGSDLRPDVLKNHEAIEELAAIKTALRAIVVSGQPLSDNDRLTISQAVETLQNF